MHPFHSTRSMQIVHEQMVKEGMDRARDYSERKKKQPDRNRIILLLKKLGKHQKLVLAEARTRLLALLSPHHALRQKCSQFSQSDACDISDTRSPFDV